MERFNRTLIEQLTIYKQNEEMNGKQDQYSLKLGLHHCVKYYNNKWHGTIRCTPEEAFC